jgi:tetratricopeptide (TPR) repeat protein
MCYVMLAMLNQTRGRFARATAEIGHLAALDPAWACVLRGLYALHPYSGASAAEMTEVRASLERWDAARSIPNRNRVLALHNGLQPALRLYLIGSLSARLADGASAAAMADALARSGDGAHVPGFTAHLARSVRAQAARAAGDAAGALRILDEAPLELWYQLAVTSPVFAAPLERFLRAELLEELGREEEAMGWYAALGETSPHELPYVAPAQLRLAGIHARQGRADAAAACRARAEQLWGTA